MPVTRVIDAASDLLELDQGAAEILGVQEKDRLAVGAGFRLAVAEHARAGRLEAIARGDDVVDLVADMVHAAGGVAREELRDRRGRAQRMQQLDLGVRQGDEDSGDAVLGQIDGLRHLGAERAAISGAGRRRDSARRSRRD